MPRTMGGRGGVGDVTGYQARRGRPLGEQFRGFHGSPVPGIDEIKPSSEVGGWVNHLASHPDKVYAASEERHAWEQAEMAGSKRLMESVAEEGRGAGIEGEGATWPPELLPDPEDSPTPTVYDTTLRGNVDSDPEYDEQFPDRATPMAARGRVGEVNREIPMPPESQGTLLPDYFGRQGEFSAGFRGSLFSEETNSFVSGARYERTPGTRLNMDEVLHGPRDQQHTILDNSRIPGDQMNRVVRDRQVRAALRGNAADYDPAIRDAARGTGEQLFRYADVADTTSSNFPYGKPAGWDQRREAFVAETKKPSGSQGRRRDTEVW